MSERGTTRSVLVVEDDFHVADWLALELEAHGFDVLGPVATVRAALDVVAKAERIDGAILDINLRGEMAYPVADALRERSVPFVFTTGYDASSVARYAPDAVCFEKPALTTHLIRALFGDT